jgi:hypothetical protein
MNPHTTLAIMLTICDFRSCFEAHRFDELDRQYGTDSRAEALANICPSHSQSAVSTGSNLPWRGTNAYTCHETNNSW